MMINNDYALKSKKSNNIIAAVSNFPTCINTITNNTNNIIITH
jgi:hypothetical protein